MTLESLSSEDRRSSPGIRGQMGERASSPSAGARGRHLGGGLRSSGVEAARVSRIGKIAKARVLGKSPLGVFLRVNQSIWDRLPRSVTAARPAITYGRLVHALARRGDRRMSPGTFFLRNRPQIRLITHLAGLRARAGVVRIAVLGCSIGADAYSLQWSIRSTRPDLKVDMLGVDISPEILEVARKGSYSLGVSDVAHTPILERLTEAETNGMFDRDERRLRVKPWLKEGVRWRVADAGDPRIVDDLGPQDLVVANDFLCHLEPAEAERCLRNVARLVDPGGYLVLSGVDLDVRTKVATDLGWTPVRDLMDAIHDGDPVLRRGWPGGYWGLEPLDKRRPDWDIRYVSVFQVGAAR